MEKHVLELSGAPTTTRPKTGRNNVKATEPVADRSQRAAITFPQGLIGCPDWQHFDLLPVPIETWGEMISTDHAGLALIIADPAFLQIRYNLELDEDDVDALQLVSADDARIYVILTIRHEPSTAGGPAPTVTANVAGPLVINQRTNSGRQVVLDHQNYPLRSPILSGEAAQAFIDAFEDAGLPYQSPVKGTGEGA